MQTSVPGIRRAFTRSYLTIALLLGTVIEPAPAQRAPAPQSLFEDASDLLGDFTLEGSGFTPFSDGLFGAAWFDYNNDGHVDLMIPNGGGPNALFRNNGDGTFTDAAEAAGIAGGQGHSGALAGDIDNDGCPDLYLSGDGWITTQEESPAKLYINNCDGTFSDITEQAGIPTPPQDLMAAFGDINNDGLLDLFVTNPGSLRTREQPPSKLFLNNGDRTFTDISEAAGIDTSFGSCVVSFHDFDDDGRQDILVGNCNDVALGSAPVELFRNNGDLTFTDVAAEAGLTERGYWMAIDFADYDRDGDQDFFLTNLGTAVLNGKETHVLYENTGDGRYTEVGREAGVAAWEWGWGASFADFDNDGYEDLMMAGSFPIPPFSLLGLDEGNPGRVFLNRGNKRLAPFEDFGLSAEYTSGLAVGDFQSDGFQDAVILRSRWRRGGEISGSGTPLLLANRGNGNAWLTVEAAGTRSNRDAAGARVRILYKGQTQIKEIRRGASFLSTNSAWLTFGLGAAELADVEIHWPSGIVERFGPFEARQKVRLEEGSGSEARVVAWRAANAASLSSGVAAPAMIATLVGEGLAARTVAAASLPLPAELDGVSLELIDAEGASHTARLLMVSPEQVNWIVPSGAALGPATLLVHAAEESAFTALRIEQAAPGLFAANGVREGVAAAVAVRIAADGTQTVEPAIVFDPESNVWQAAPLELGPPGEELILLLFGTGLRGLKPAELRVSVGGEPAEVLGLAPQSEFEGLDQVNLVVPRTLAGAGEVEIRLTAGRLSTNTVTVELQ